LRPGACTAHGSFEKRFSRSRSEIAGIAEIRMFGTLTYN
jgi:hypothetical protein